MPAVNFASVFMTGILACSAGLNVYQTKRIRDLSGGPADPLAVGSKLPPLTAKDLPALPGVHPWDRALINISASGDTAVTLTVREVTLAGYRIEKQSALIPV